VEIDGFLKKYIADIESQSTRSQPNNLSGKLKATRVLTTEEQTQHIGASSTEAYAALL